MFKNQKEWWDVYDDLGNHTQHIDSSERLSMAFILSGIHTHDALFLEMKQLSHQAEKYFQRVRAKKIQIDVYIGEVEQMIEYLLNHQELCKWSRWSEWYTLLTRLHKRIGTKQMLLLWKSAEYTAFCQRQKYYQWLHTLMDGDGEYNSKNNSADMVHTLVSNIHEEHVQKTEFLYGWEGWTLYPEEKEDK